MKFRNWLMVLLAWGFFCSSALLFASEKKSPDGEKKSLEPVDDLRREARPAPFHGEKGDFRRGPRRPGGPGGQFKRGGRKGSGHFFARFTPEERASLREFIRKKDHAGFQKKMRELRIKYASPEDRKVMELRESYHKAKTPAEKAFIKDALKKAVRIQMERRLEFMKGQIRSAEEKLNRLKKFYEHNLAEKEKMVERRLDSLCKHPSESPMPPFHGKRVPPRRGENR